MLAPTWCAMWHGRPQLLAAQHATALRVGLCTCWPHLVRQLAHPGSRQHRAQHVGQVHHHHQLHGVFGLVCWFGLEGAGEGRGGQVGWR